MNNQYLRIIEDFKKEVEIAGSPKTWFAIGVGLSVILFGSLLLFQVIRRRRDSIEVQKAIDKFSVTEDGSRS